MIVKVCVGSSCHLKGSYDIIEEFKKLINEYDVKDQVELKASFCVGNCKEGVNVSADEVFIHYVSADKTREVFLTEVLPKIKRD